MNNAQKVALLAALLMACIGVVIFGSRNNETTTNDLREDVAEIAAGNPLRLDLSSLLGPYRVELVTEGDPEGDVKGQADVDSRGNIRTTIEENGVENIFLYVDGISYIRVAADDSWIKFGGAGSGANSRSPFSADELSVGYSQENIEALIDIEQASENESCALGTCRVYNATNPVTNESAVISVENSSNRISEIELEAENGKRTSISYTYNEAILPVTPPENFKEFYTSGTE